MGDVIEFGSTRRCAKCKGTGRRDGKKGGSICRACIGKGYIVEDTCWHICGCTQRVDSTLVFICMMCYSGKCGILDEGTNVNDLQIK